MRLPLSTARPLAERIRAELAPLCRRCEIAGSIRRERADCGDIDLVCLPLTWPHRARILERCDRNAERVKNGPQYVEYRLKNGFQLDLWFAHDGACEKPQPGELFETPRETLPPNFGVLLLARTGSVAFNTWIAQHAKTKGLHFNPHAGIQRAGRVIASEEEADIFRALELPEIPPTRRDDYVWVGAVR